MVIWFDIFLNQNKLFKSFSLLRFFRKNIFLESKNPCNHRVMGTVYKKDAAIIY